MNKKIIITIIVVILIIALGVGYYLYNQNKNNESLNETRVEESTPNNTPNQDGSNQLVVYFSVPETTDPNKEMTEEEENSTIIVDGEVLGNTQYVAMLISDYTKASIYRIEPETPYTTNHEDLVDQALEEQNNNARPAIKESIPNFDDYDIIYLGYPNWWGDMPMIIYTFLESYDFSGKTIIPFNTHGGSGLSDTVNSIKEEVPTATVEENAFTLSRDDMESAPSLVESWLQEINMLA